MAVTLTAKPPQAPRAESHASSAALRVVDPLAKATSRTNSWVPSRPNGVYTAWRIDRRRRGVEHGRAFGLLGGAIGGLVVARHAGTALPG